MKGRLINNQKGYTMIELMMAATVIITLTTALIATSNYGYNKALEMGETVQKERQEQINKIFEEFDKNEVILFNPLNKE